MPASPLLLRAAVSAGLLYVGLASAAQAQNLVSGGSAPVSAVEVEAAVQQFPLASRRSMLARPEQVERIARDVYVRRQLAEQGVHAGLDRDPLVAAMLRLARERILADAQLYEIGKAAWPDDATLERYARERYAADPQRFVVGARTRARHILIAPGEGASGRDEARSRAEMLRRELVAGASFEALAAANSADQASASRGGDLGFFAPGTMVPAFERAVDALRDPGELSPVVETQFGFHLIRLEERRDAGRLSFDDARADLVRQARDQAHREAQERATRTLLEAARIDAVAVEEFARRHSRP